MLCSVSVGINPTADLKNISKLTAPFFEWLGIPMVNYLIHGPLLVLIQVPLRNLRFSGELGMFQNEALSLMNRVSFSTQFLSPSASRGLLIFLVLQWQSKRGRCMAGQMEVNFPCQIYCCTLKKELSCLLVLNFVVP